MARSRPFGLFILLLCLVACVCAHGDVSYDDAKKAVNAARHSANKVYEKAKEEAKDTVQLKDGIDIYKGRAERAATEAEKAARGNSEAVTIAQKAKRASDDAHKLYPSASDQAKKYLESMKDLRTKAKNLDEKAKNDLYISRVSANNYTKIKEDADAIKIQAEALNTEINKESSSFSGMHAKENEMLKFASDAQLARYHVDVIVAVAKINTLLESADTDIKLIEKKRDEINVTEQEMNDLYDNGPKDLNQYIFKLRSTVKYEFQSASRAVEEAKKTKEGILQQKAQANGALVKVKDETNVEDAKDEVSHVNGVAKNAEKNVEEIKKALGSATYSAENALYQKEAAVNAINAKTKKPDATQDNKKTNPPDSSNTQQPVKDTTESPTVSGTKQPTITIPGQPLSEQPVQVTTERPTVIETKKPTTTNPDQSKTEQPVQVTTESPMVVGTKKPKTTKPYKRGSGRKEPKQPSNNDSAMTVSVSLLLALIACASLQ